MNRGRPDVNEHQTTDETDLQRRIVIQAAGFAMAGGLAVPTAGARRMRRPDARPASAAARNSGPLGARLQGVQHFGLTVQNMDRAFAFYTEVLGGTEVMRDGDFQGERIHNTLLTDQEIEARVRQVNPRTHGHPGPERRRAAAGRAVHPVRQRGDRTAAVPRRRAARRQRRRASPSRSTT